MSMRALIVCCVIDKLIHLTNRDHVAQRCSIVLCVVVQLIVGSTVDLSVLSRGIFRNIASHALVERR